MKDVLKMEEITRSYKMSSNKIEVIKGITLSVKEGEFLGIMGKSGGGKTTLLRLMGLLDRPDSGKIFFGDTDTSELWKDELADIRRREIGFVFQEAVLADYMTVKQNMILPMIFDKASSEKMNEKVAYYAKRLHIEHLLNKKPSQLSGGEKQRVDLGRALLNDPHIILADEPTGSLDSKTGEEVIELLLEINRLGKTLIMVTHDPQMASRCKKVIFLKDGVILNSIEKTEEEKEKPFLDQILKEMEKL
nr:ABC transporter ATP-binding protein [uncultured Sellimonas sp.]